MEPCQVIRHQEYFILKAQNTVRHPLDVIIHLTEAAMLNIFVNLL